MESRVRDGPRAAVALKVVEVLAVCWLGTMAGFFFAFAVDVAPAMMNLDGPGYVNTQQWINKVVRNAVFALAYFGSVVLPACAALCAGWAGQRGRAMLWAVLSLVYFVAVFWVTRRVNVPINNELATWLPASPPADWLQARSHWNEANLLRTAAAMVCFVCAVVLITLPLKRRG